MTHTRHTILAVPLLALALAGCASINVAVQPAFNHYDRVAIVPRLSPADEETFLPAYMEAFPLQQLVERRDLQAIFDEQDLLPERLNPATRARLHEVLGVQAVIYPSAAWDKAAIRVIDTSTGAISASCVVQWDRGAFSAPDSDDRIRKAIGALYDEALLKWGPLGPPAGAATRTAAHPDR